ncbi:DUF2515 domain-containing protein [Bacillus sp. HMF5848]|uniref:DUF2515 domain-containing protein n=1 Tax=Bacillus sp. HMF5848 TaxID=2495421 RepID=UPI000F7A8476|nr:DUF2515 domain-containing protein [Bacillus sp. HMF5848]RSK27391.1 DUF2515 domain-containing protein [Bacillus sp. HMF5848]
MSEAEFIQQIKNETNMCNIDNISRTKAYGVFFEKWPDIRWALLASFVSRNAGWSMTDLQGRWFPKALSDDTRKHLFITYERANWLIFLDAYPQLLLYEKSKIVGKPLFYLLSNFNVSQFMEKEWNYYWHCKDKTRLMYALIINEQNVIQKPVIESPLYKKRVFKSFVFKIQDLMHFSIVIFPTLQGKLYGCSVHDFTNLKDRIELGKRLAHILFERSLFKDFFLFHQETEHTGSRSDYEKYLHKKSDTRTPILRLIYPIIYHHRSYFKDWYFEYEDKKLDDLFSPPQFTETINITEWYHHKQRQLQLGIKINHLFHNKI